MTIVEWIARAHHEHWALGQFNISNLEVLQAIVEAANQERSPVIVGVSMGSLRHIGRSYLAGLISGARQVATVPLFFHLDHGADLETVCSCIDIGFDSVMLDASRASVAENIRLVRQAVAYAHPRNVGVEAQIGETWDEETGDMIESRTDPAQIADFVEQSGIDYVAISFGNTPGRWEGAAAVDIDLIRTCAAVSPVPIVLHGGSSIPDEAMRLALTAGAAKVNIDTVLRRAATELFRTQYCSQMPPADPRKVFSAARDAVRQTVATKMQLFGSSNKVPS